MTATTEQQKSIQLNRNFMAFVEEYMGKEQLAKMAEEIAIVASGYAIGKGNISAGVDVIDVFKQVLGKGFAAGCYAMRNHPNDIKFLCRK